VVQVLKKQDGLTWEEDGVVYMEERIYIPNNKKIREEILKENHDSVDLGHPGQYRMLELLKRTYWWPGLKEDIKRDALNVSKIKFNTKEMQENYIHWKFRKDHGKKSV